MAKPSIGQKIKKPVFWVSILGGAKMVLGAFGVDVITEDQIDDIANGIATVCVLAGIFADYVEEEWM